MPENRNAPRISVQRRSARTLIEGQLGTGALVAPDVVMLTPETLARVNEWDGYIDIILGPAVSPAQAEADLDGVVERRAVVSLQEFGIAPPGERPDGEPDPTGDRDIAMVTLDAPSEYLPVLELGTGPDVERQTAEFEQALAGGADFWEALERARIIPPGFREPPVDDWLANAERVLALTRFVRKVRREVAAVKPSWCFPFWWRC